MGNGKITRKLKELGLKINGVEPKGDTTSEIIKGIADDYTGGGTTVVANPTLAGTEEELTGLQVGETKFKVGGGDENTSITTLTDLFVQLKEKTHYVGTYYIDKAKLIEFVNKYDIDGSGLYIGYVANDYYLLEFHSDSSQNYEMRAFGRGNTINLGTAETLVEAIKNYAGDFKVNIYTPESYDNVVSTNLLEKKCPVKDFIDIFKVKEE